MLHIVKHYHSISDVIAYSAEDDELLLIEDGVYAALPEHKSNKEINLIQESVYCLSADVEARGLAINHKFKSVDFMGFVELTEKHSSSITWD